MSLRERKKRQTRDAIIEVAETLFSARGLEAATMEEVAAGADVSVGTVYNYFGSKPALLLAIFESETSRMLEAGAAVVDAPGADPSQAVATLFDRYLDVMLAVDRRLMREVLRSWMDGESVGELMRLDEQLVSQLAGLLEGFQNAGAIRAGVELGDAALVLFSVFVTQLLLYVSVESVTPEVVGEGVRRQVGHVFAGLSPRTDERKR